MQYINGIILFAHSRALKIAQFKPILNFFIYHFLVKLIQFLEHLY